MRFFIWFSSILQVLLSPVYLSFFSLRKITKSNFYHHLPTLNIANLFMQSFASPLPSPHPTPIPHPTKITHHKSNTTNQTPQIYAPPTQKGRNYRLYLRPFYPKIHRKGATIAYTHALSIQKSIERAQLSPMPQEKFVNICANSWLKTTNTGSTNHADFLLNPCNNFNHKLAQIILRRILWKYDNICVTLLWHKICSINYATQFML